MSVTLTRKAVFLTLAVLTGIMLFASKSQLIYRIDTFKGVLELNSTGTKLLNSTKTVLRITNVGVTGVSPTWQSRSFTSPWNPSKTGSKRPDPSDPYLALDTLVEQFQQSIESIRNRVLMENITITRKSNWTLLDGYDENIFKEVKKFGNIYTILLTSSFEETQNMLPVKKYYNHVASKETCAKMATNSYNGPRLLNKTCLNDVRLVHNPVSVDRTQLSVGIPFKMSEHKALPIESHKDDVLLDFGFVVKDALILSHGIVFSNGSALQPQRCKPDGKTKLPANQSSIPLHNEVFSMTEQTGSMYYHLILEDLPRIGPYLKFLLKHKHIKVHCKNKMFSNQMLELLGITRDRLVFGNIRAKVAYVPAGTACGRPGVFTTLLLSTLFHRKLPKNVLNLNQDTIILIKRSSEGRQFKNHEGILKMLRNVAKKRGLRVSVFGDRPVPPLNKTIEMFYRAIMVLAPHGAGLSNLVFSRPGVVVLESYCMVNLCFRNLMANIGHIHHGYMNIDFSCLRARPENFQADVEKHLDILRLKSAL